MTKGPSNAKPSAQDWSDLESDSEDMIRSPACGFNIEGSHNTKEVQVPKIELPPRLPPHLPYGLCHLLTINMVDFHNPAVFEEDFGACISWHSSRTWAVPLTRLWKRHYQSSGTSWMEFLCKPSQLSPSSVPYHLIFPDPAGSSSSLSITN